MLHVYQHVTINLNKAGIIFFKVALLSEIGVEVIFWEWEGETKDE